MKQHRNRLLAGRILVSLLLIFFCATAKGADNGVVIIPVDERPLPEKVELRYFHDTACGSCDGTTEIMDIVSETIGDISDQYPYTLYSENVFYTRGRDKYEKIMDEIGLSQENIFFPLLIVNSKIYQGRENIRENLREAYLTAGEDIFVNQYVYWPSYDKDKPLFKRYEADPEHATAVYFYRITCEECERLKPFMDALPESLHVNGQETALDVIRINTRSGNNGERIAALFEYWQVPEEDQMVPIVFLANGYIAGQEAIEAELLTRLEAGEGMGFTFPEIE